MHILIVPSWYPDPKNPVRGIFFQEQAASLQEAGHRVGVLPFEFLRPGSFQMGPGVDGLLGRERVSVEAGLNIYRAGLSKLALPTLLLHGGWAERFGLEVFAHYCRENGQPDVLHAQSSLYGGYLAARIREQTGVPLLVTEHYSKFNTGVPAVLKPLARFVYRSADGLQAVSPALASAMQPYAPGKPIEVTGNPVDEQFFDLPAAPPAPTPFVFSALCSLTKIKGIDLLLRAFAEAFRNEAAELRIAGNGPERSSLERLAHSLGIAGQAHFLGFLSREESRDLIQHSHVVVSSSHVETFGLTLIEAMACGKPVVSTRSGGPESFVTGENGFLVPPGDVGALADAMREARAGYARFQPGAIRAGCIARFGREGFTRRLEETYHRLMTGRKTG